jgi:hypothetical protein
MTSRVILSMKEDKKQSRINERSKERCGKFAVLLSQMDSDDSEKCASNRSSCWTANDIMLVRRVLRYKKL